MPARRFLPDQQAELVAGVEEVRRLGIVRAAHHVAVELVLEDLGVLALHPGGHGHAGVRVELVPVEPEQLQPLPVQEEALGPEGRLAEPDPPGQHVAADAGEVQRGLDRVQLRAVRRPQPDRPEPGQAQLGGAGPGRADRHRRGLRRDLRLPVEQLDQQGAGGVRRRGRVNGALDVDPGLRAEHVGRLGEQVGEEHLREHPQPDVPVDAAGLEEVDAGRAAADADRRHRQAARVHDDREQVVAAGDLAGEFGREGQVAALVGADHLVVDRHRRVDHDAVEVHEDPVARTVRVEQVRPVEVPPVDPHLLPGGVVPVLPGQRGDRVRHRDRREVAVVEEAALRARRVLPAEQPVRVHREGEVGRLLAVRVIPPTSAISGSAATPAPPISPACSTARREIRRLTAASRSSGCSSVPDPGVLPAAGGASPGPSGSGVSTGPAAMARAPVLQVAA